MSPLYLYVTILTVQTSLFSNTNKVFYHHYSFDKILDDILETGIADVGIQWDPNDILGEEAVDVVPCEASAEEVTQNKPTDRASADEASKSGSDTNSNEEVFQTPEVIYH